MSFQCHSMGEEVSLGPAFSQLKQEHVQLREQMELSLQLAQAIGEDDSISDWRDLLNVLREKAIQFQRQLYLHSKREDDFVFPAIAKYIGRETGPIAVMEYEHKLAKKNLESFITKAGQLNEPVNAEQAKEIAIFMIDCCTVLSDHFMKEEKVLFPMGERLLSDREKDDLEKMIQTV
ncbi:hemerythrin domain-containing protein [Thermoactinomyces sp. AMNI-1]|uniref:Hemerythrin domain-containing protein n=2 Tax=Thermoactinomyces mirandus TaxID=2756294 RepID=A0A7W2AS52_9BACL|nr:hemerythrin domain-containing protein [Thermoactinomyces mirandus]